MPGFGDLCFGCDWWCGCWFAWFVWRFVWLLMLLIRRGGLLLRLLFASIGGLCGSCCLVGLV